jgi:DNA primase
MDVITAHQNGLKNVVASMGTSVTEKQVSALKKLSRNMVLALDADAAGEEAMARSVGYENILDAEVKVVILPAGKDPDDVIKEDVKIWQELLAKALPIVDFTFNMVTSKLDLTTARDKSLAVDKLLPIIAEIKDIVRQAHYLQKLAHLVKVNERSLEATLRRTGVSQGRRQAEEPRQEAMTRASHPFLSSPLEEYCLTLLLQHPELKGNDEGLLPEYFENTENREIFIAWQQANELSSLKDKLDITIHEHLDSLIKKNIPANQIGQKYADSVRRLQEKWLRNLEVKKAEVLTSEAESGGTAAELAKLEELGVSTQLGEVFTQRSRMKLGAKEVRSEPTKQ